MLRFIFEPDVSQLLAWVTIRIRCGAEWKMFPGIVRKKSIEHMWRAYRSRAEAEDNSDGQKFGRSVFIKLVRLITRGEQKSEVVGTLHVGGHCL